MDFNTFQQSLTMESPPQVSAALQALWWDAKGGWEKAHRTAQDDPSPNGSWVHAYLHRKEGDQWNAEYWYRRAQKSVPKKSLRAEWEGLVREMLKAKENS
ncbi:MAG: hypothetical protein KC713_00240 [Candidatus Omnitrophica bacterium]|nr:hypothetical protein [Candidatus Omnitrophota bacterium]